MSFLLFATQFAVCYLLSRLIEREVADYKSRKAHERIMAYGAYKRKRAEADKAFEENYLKD